MAGFEQRLGAHETLKENLSPVGVLNELHKANEDGVAGALLGVLQNESVADFEEMLNRNNLNLVDIYGVPNESAVRFSETVRLWNNEKSPLRKKELEEQIVDHVKKVN